MVDELGELDELGEQPDASSSRELKKDLGELCGLAQVILQAAERQGFLRCKFTVEHLGKEEEKAPRRAEQDWLIDGLPVPASRPAGLSVRS
jgi:hypothetical protein